MMNRVVDVLLACVLMLAVFEEGVAQSKHWQNTLRTEHYTEDNGDFLLVDGKYRFNRALYGNHKPSRVEAGDLPEFALYFPGMGGNLQFVLESGGIFKKLIDADRIETRYRPGSMVYTITDALLGTGKIDLTILAQEKEEGLVVKFQAHGVSTNGRIHAIYGGASGKKFSRGGDIGADPESSFYLLPEYTENNRFSIHKTDFELTYLNGKKEKELVNGSFLGAEVVNVTDVTFLERLSGLSENSASASPIVYATFNLQESPRFIRISKGALDGRYSQSEVQSIFEQAEQARLSLVNRVKINTPDRFINTLGGALTVASDGVWESPTYLHGAVAWRMRLNAWRGAYTANTLGWHDRAKAHFSSYSNSQVLEPAQGPVVMDTALHLARHIEEMGTAMFSSGYISRHPNNNTVAHHYDMNLVFFDQIFSYFNYTGDKEFLIEIWPTIKRHLAWERRNFKRNGLYDAYCAIWASDALQYSGGGVAHTTAYNYRANTMAAKFARILGEDPQIFEQEAKQIEEAMLSRLWLKDRGYFAEYQDTLGKQLVHDMPGLWTIYHVADAHLLDDFDNYQNTRYIDNFLPHIPISVQGRNQEGLYTLATTTWQPYTWSVNNVALAENLQASLAFWQSGRMDEAFLLWKSNLIESMYNGVSPGNFQQLSFYDAFRGELYRDFADPIGVASRTLTEGLFGYHPQLMDDYVFIKPGFPSDWDYAEIELPDWSYSYKKDQQSLSFEIVTHYQKQVGLKMEIPIDFSAVKSVQVNGKEVSWNIKETSLNRPFLVLEAPRSNSFSVEITGEGELQTLATETLEQAYSEVYTLDLPQGVELLDVYDPQGVIKEHTANTFKFNALERKGTYFVHLKQDQVQWWQAINLRNHHPVDLVFQEDAGKHSLTITNLTHSSQRVLLDGIGLNEELSLGAQESKIIALANQELTRGTNLLQVEVDGSKWTERYVNWEIQNKGKQKTVDLSKYYNAKLSDIFQEKYVSPRPLGPTLQLPWQGIGNWCYPLITANIDDSGLMAARNNGELSYLGVPFLVSGDKQNVLFTSRWDNYPTQVEIPAKGKAKKVYLLLAGSTNPMQSQMVNAQLKVVYQDQTEDVLELKNPVNWWPIEQDYLDDNYAFEIPDQEVPYRVKLKTGELYKGGELSKYDSIKGYTDRAIDGGAATLLDLPLQGDKQVKSIELEAITNDVVVGIIAVTFLYE
ncbi:MAG TPA: DUF4450 domain-containing protein [Candidatus Sphingobacterium stercoripullorum]|uniref:DUF4450 domain-containing protein n=1 Tax=Candidatus Sphingobacterium stercoripullorum TaxID=2838759 RepID=A0A9D2AYV0_9SPHI|nr:DUF4450 domain-containing protein [Candidatus Sphingobacterium stercoripullorum]